MKLKITNILLLSLALLFPLISAAHPLKLSASLIEYDPKDKTIRLECKVFLDDFERSLSQSVLKGVDVSTVKRQERPKIIEAYFNEFYRITFNGKKLPLEYASIIPLKEHNVLIIKFKRTPFQSRRVTNSISRIRCSSEISAPPNPTVLLSAFLHLGSRKEESQHGTDITSLIRLEYQINE